MNYANNIFDPTPIPNVFPTYYVSYENIINNFNQNYGDIWNANDFNEEENNILNDNGFDISTAIMMMPENDDNENELPISYETDLEDLSDDENDIETVLDEWMENFEDMDHFDYNTIEW